MVVMCTQNARTHFYPRPREYVSQCSEWIVCGGVLFADSMGVRLRLACHGDRVRTHQAITSSQKMSLHQIQNESKKRKKKKQAAKWKATREERGINSHGDSPVSQRCVVFPSSIHNLWMSEPGPPPTQFTHNEIGNAIAWSIFDFVRFPEAETCSLLLREIKSLACATARAIRPAESRWRTKKKRIENI